jgi:predicted nucleotide-binding protein (sugar kinase/HSP70/actin superfamily)
MIKVLKRRGLHSNIAAIGDNLGASQVNQLNGLKPLMGHASAGSHSDETKLTDIDSSLKRLSEMESTGVA